MTVGTSGMGTNTPWVTIVEFSHVTVKMAPLNFKLTVKACSEISGYIFCTRFESFFVGFFFPRGHRGSLSVIYMGHKVFYHNTMLAFWGVS